MDATLHVGQDGFETFLAKEAGSLVQKGPGWALCRSKKTDLCFAHLSLIDPIEVSAETANALAGGLSDYFHETSRGERYDAVWPLCFEAASLTGLSSRCRGIEDLFMKKTSRMARVMKLSEKGRPGLGPSRGLFVYLAGFKRAFASRLAWGGGQRRMADDPRAPSRSYLKVEEAYLILREAPGPGETVADLGAAPGGWSYSAARRGASVTAVDNGPLKSGAALDPRIEARAEDAFTYQPPSRVDWLFCDLLADPRDVLKLLVRWAEKAWCRRFIVNLKFGRHDPLMLLEKIHAEETGLARRCQVLRARHCYHDREEITVTGILKT